MAKLNVAGIRKLALSIVERNPGGIRWASLIRKIAEEHPETPHGTITGSCRNLDRLYPEKVSRPERGLYLPVQPDAEESTETPAASSDDSGTSEKDFYKPFAEWLRDDLDEVTHVVPLGGKALGAKWGTPDVVGVYRPSAADLIKFHPEIVSVEIKTDPRQPVVAFGQAISYRLFSTKTYVVIPTSISAEDSSRLEALCILFGVGFVLFSANPQDPNFIIRVRAQRFSPDMFHVNAFAERLKLIDRESFKILFD